MDAIDRPWSDEREGADPELRRPDLRRLRRPRRGVARHDTSEVAAIAGGRVWSGAQAVETGWSTRSAASTTRWRWCATRPASPDDIEVDHLPQPRSFADTLFESMFESSVLAGERGKLAALLQRFGRIDVLLTLLQQAVAGDTQGKVWAMLPGDLRVQ